MENFQETREITVNKRGSIRIFCSVLSCLLLVVSIPILILQTNKTQNERSKHIKNESEYDIPVKENGSISELAVSIGNRQRVEIPDIQTEPPCKCPLPFYPAANCALCFHIPSYTENNFVRLIQYSKQAAMEICVNELKGEVPSSELPYHLHFINLTNF